MGDHEHWAQPSGVMPNGLLPDTVCSVTRFLDTERWTIAERRTEELINCIQPSKPSEERRNAVADYVQRLITKCFSCKVFMFGSVPLKTYLPDGDIDLTAFSDDETLKDTWANEVRNILESEEKSETAEFRVKEVQYIQAEVKLIKCLVENIVVDISFNQLGGLCTLCFLEEVDYLIKQNHIFKRSIILIKAWCYYESRILGAHHGLISTYALETLVLYIFHVFNNSFAGPLEVLYRFLEFFSNFDWDNFCVSLWGPVPICRLADMTVQRIVAEPPRRDTGDLLLNNLFDACSSVYSVGGQDNQGQSFVSKHFNVIDPLRINNNLGRSVSKGNFFRIRSAFAFGAKRLARLLDCPKENVISEVNLFFLNTLGRHGSRHRPDAPNADLVCLQPSIPDHVIGSENIKHPTSSKKKIQESPGSQAPERISRTSNFSATSRTGRKRISNLNTSRVTEHLAKNVNPGGAVNTERGHRKIIPDHLANEVQSTFPFGRTHSSPELTDTSTEVSRGRHNKVPETVGKQITAKAEFMRRKNVEVSGTHSAKILTEDSSSSRSISSHQSLDVVCDPNKYHDEVGFGSTGEELASVADRREMCQEAQDMVNMMASTRLHGLHSHMQYPMNLASPHLPLPLSPSVLASVGYARRNLMGMIPADMPLVEPLQGNIPFPENKVSLPLPRCFPTVESASNQVIAELSSENSGLTEDKQMEGRHRFWHDQDAAGSTRGLDADDGAFQVTQSDESTSHNFAHLTRVSSSGSSIGKGRHKFAKESKNQNVSHQNKYDRGHEAHSPDRHVNTRSLPTSEPGSSRSKTSSESSWDGSSAKVSKSSRDKRGRRSTPSVDSCTTHNKGKNGWSYDDVSVDNSSSQADDDNKEWIQQTETVEGGIRPTSVASLNAQTQQLPSHETSSMSGSDSMVPFSPVLVGTGSRQRTMENPGMLPFAFYQIGPPVPFLTMLPMYNVPTGTETSTRPTSNTEGEEGLDNYSHTNQSDQNFDSVESRDQSEVFSSCNSSRDGSSTGLPEEHKSDILKSDFTSHWENLQFARLCQNPRCQGPSGYPSSVMVPPMYLQGHFPWDGSGRPLSPNGNLLTQFTSYGPRLIPVSQFQPGPQRSNGVYQRYVDESPRYRGGTGTYLPNRKVPFRERQSSSIRNHKVNNNNYDRNEHHSEREGTWNMGFRQRSAGPNNGLSDKPSTRSDLLAANESQADYRPFDLYRHEAFSSYQSQNGSFRPPASIHSNYGMYPMVSVNSNGVSSTGPAGPSVVMLYPYDQNVGYSSPSDHVEFGSVRQGSFSCADEVPQEVEVGPARFMYERRRIQGGLSAQSSPDEPSSPRSQRRN
ncbi:hypothetical protein MKW94_016726 [Papaver nudicaule]|uniref:Polymerase nucleotidyl transferase domain-containing protein n=1 Tax=Papaver nudicaule TaxID=74823 RepID=A0AA41VRZ6_PAPNU|nr:hypothetical protein [Papaver nudicaule]